MITSLGFTGYDHGLWFIVQEFMVHRLRANAAHIRLSEPDMRQSEPDVRQSEPKSGPGLQANT